MPPPYTLALLLLPAVLLTLSPAKSTVEATESSERSPGEFKEVNNTTSATPTPAVRTTPAAREFAANPRDNAPPKSTSPPPPHQTTPLVNTSRTAKRKRPPRIRLIKVYKKVWRSPKRQDSTLDPSSGNGTNASNRTLSRKQPASITVIELPLKPVPEEEKIESILQLQQSSNPLKSTPNDKESSKENENERSWKQKTLAESLENKGDIKESTSSVNKSFERTPIHSIVEKEKLVPSSETQSHSDKKSSKLTSTRDEKNSKPNPSYSSDLGKKEDSVEEYSEVSRANQNNFPRNKDIASSVVERFLDLQSEAIQNLNRNITKSRIREQNVKKETNEHIINEHNGTSEEHTAARDLNCTTDTNSSETLLRITSCQNGSTPNDSEQTTQTLINLNDNESPNEAIYETSTDDSEIESTSKNITNEEMEYENKDSTPSSNQYNGKQFTELINESDTTTELTSKGKIEVMESGQFAVPVNDASTSEKHKDSINGENYFGAEMEEIHRDNPEIFDEVYSTAKPDITHSSVNFEDSPQAYGSITRNVPNIQDNIGASHSTVEHTNPNVSELSTRESIIESTDSIFSARMSGESSHSNIPTELSSKSRVEEVMERGQFTFPEDVSTKEQHLDSENGDNDAEKSDRNRSMSEIIARDDINYTTELGKIHSSANFKDTPRELNSIPADTPNLPDDLSDTYSKDRYLTFSIAKLSTLTPTKERMDSVVTERKTEESFDSAFTTELTPPGKVEELMKSGQLYLPIDNVSSEEQSQDSINITNYDPGEENVHRDEQEIFDDDNTTTEPGVTDSLENFENMARGYDSIPRNESNLKNSLSYIQSTDVDTNRSKPSTRIAMVENTLTGRYDSEFTTEPSSKDTIEKVLENSVFLSLLDSENYGEQNETSENERAYFIKDNSTSESKTPPQTGKETNEYEPIVKDSMTHPDLLNSSSSINEFSSSTNPESSTSILIKHNALENETFTYAYTSTNFSSKDQEKDLFTTSDVESRKDEHRRLINEEMINTEHYLDNSTRETDSPKASKVLTDVQNEYKESLNQLNPLDNTHSTNENSSTRNSESSTTSTMDISSTENRLFFYMDNVTNNKTISPKDVPEFTEIPYVSVSSETTMSSIEDDGTTPEIQKDTNYSESTSDFDSAVFAKVFKNTEYPSILNRKLNRNEDTKELSPWTRSQSASFDVTENSVKFLPEGSTESVPVSGMTQEHSEQSIELRTENLLHLNVFYQTTEIASEKSRKSLDQVENKNYSDRDMTNHATEQISVPLFTEYNPESLNTIKYSEITQKPTLLEDINYNSEGTQGMVSSDLLKMQHKSSIYSNEDPWKTFLQRETNININNININNNQNNNHTLPQIRRHSNESNWWNNQLISATETTQSFPTTKVDTCQTLPNTLKPPKIKHSRIHTTQKDLSKMKSVVRDEVSRVLGKITPIDNTFYRNMFQPSPIVIDSAPYNQATQQTNKELPIKYRLNKKLERTDNSPGKYETHLRQITSRVNSNYRPPLSSVTLPTTSSKKELPTRTYSSKYPVCFCPVESHPGPLITNDRPKMNSQVDSFYNRRIQPPDQESGAGKLHTESLQFPPFESSTKQRPTFAAPYSKTPLFSPDFTEDGVSDSKYEALIKEVENRPRTFDYDNDDDDNTISPRKKPTFEVNRAFHPRRVALKTPARHKGRRGLSKGARTFMGQSLVRSAESLPTQYAMKTGISSSCYCIPASMFDPLPDSPLPSIVPTSSVLFSTPFLNPAFASGPSIPAPNSLARLRSSEYFNLNSIPTDGLNLMQASLSKFDNFPAPIPTSVLNPTLIPPATSIPAYNSPPVFLNPRPVPSLPVPNPNTIPARTPAPVLDSVLARISIRDTLTLNPTLSHFRASVPDTILATVFTPPSVLVSDPVIPVLSSIPTSTTSFMSSIPSEDQNNFPFYLSNAPHPQLAPVSASFDAPAQTSALGSAPIPALFPASSPAHVSAPAFHDTASFHGGHSWTGGDPWDLTYNDKSTTKPMHLLPFVPTSIPTYPSPLSLPSPPLPPPPLSPPQSLSPSTSSPTSLLPLLPLLTLLSLPPSTPLLTSFHPFPSAYLPLTTPPYPPIPLSPSPPSRTPPHSLPPLVALVNPRSHAPILPSSPLILQAKAPNLPPEALQPEFEMSPSSSAPLALPSLPPSLWLPPLLQFLYSSPTHRLPLPPPRSTLSGDQPAEVNPCTRSLRKWYSRISSPPSGPGSFTQHIR